MTDLSPQGQASAEPAGSNLGRFRGVLEITEPTGEKRLVEFEADVGAASLLVNGEPVELPSAFPN